MATTVKEKRPTSHGREDIANGNFIGASVHDSKEQQGQHREGQRNYYADRSIEVLGAPSIRRYGCAYYLGTSELWHLGSISAAGCRGSQVANIQESFIYTRDNDDLLPNHEESIGELFEESLSRCII